MSNNLRKKMKENQRSKTELDLEELSPEEKEVYEIIGSLAQESGICVLDGEILIRKEDWPMAYDNLIKKNELEIAKKLKDYFDK